MNRYNRFAFLNSNGDIQDLLVQKRQIFFGGLVVMAAMPLVWLSVDDDAGDKLLRWTGNAGTRSLTRASQPLLQRQSVAPGIGSVA